MSPTHVILILPIILRYPSVQNALTIGQHVQRSHFGQCVKNPHLLMGAQYSSKMREKNWSKLTGCGKEK